MRMSINTFVLMLKIYNGQIHSGGEWKNIFRYARGTGLRDTRLWHYLRHVDNFSSKTNKSYFKLEAKIP